MPYFTYTRLKLYLDLLPVIRFLHFEAFNTRKQIAKFLLRYFAYILAQTPLKGICTFSVFLEYTFSFKIFCIFEFARPRAFQKCIIYYSDHTSYCLLNSGESRAGHVPTFLKSFRSVLERGPSTNSFRSRSFFIVPFSFRSVQFRSVLR